MARTKTKALSHPVADDAQASAAVERIGFIERQIAETDLSLKTLTAKMKVEHESIVKPLADERDARLAGLQAWAESHRVRLTNDGRVKSFELAAGRIGWRLTPPKVKVKGVEEAIAAIRKTGRKLKHFLRRKLVIELDKEAMAKEPVLALTVPGVTIDQTEEFYAEPAALELAAGSRP